MTSDLTEERKDVDGKGLMISPFPQKLSTLKLSSSNLMLWQKMVTVNLKGRRKHRHLIDDPPAPMTDDWEADDNLIMGLLYDAMEPKILDTAMQCSTAKEIWSLLQSTYSGTTSMSHAYSVSQAYSRCEMGSRSLEEYYAAFKRTCDELQEIFPLSTDLKTMQERQQQLHVLTFLGGLPKQYDVARPLLIGSPASRSLTETYHLWNLLRKNLLLRFPSLLSSNALVEEEAD